MEKSFSGKCLCGEVSFEVNGKPVVVAQCHCEECRRLSGAGHTIGAMFPVSAVSVNGELGKFKYVSSKGSEVTKAFCVSCGSPVFGTNSNSPDFMTLPLGSFDDAAGLAVEVVIFQRDKQHWDELSMDVMSFDTQPNWKPDN